MNGQIPQTSNIQPEQKPSVLGKSFVFLVTIPVIVLAGAGLIFATNFVSKEIENEKVEVLVPETDPYAGWKTYRNEEYGFEFKYPARADTEFYSSLSTQVHDKPSNGTLIEHPYTKYDISPLVQSLRKNVVVAERSAYLHSFFTSTNYSNVVLEIPLDENHRAEISYSYKSNIVPELTNKEWDQILSTFKFVEPYVDETGLFPEGKPVIESIVPSSGPIGTKVVIDGHELSGFEGDLMAVFEREDGKRIELWDEVNNYLEEPNKIEITIDEPCEKGEIVYGRYSGNPSECNYVEFTPGIYKVYVEPWGYKSNIVQFELTK